MTRDRDFSAPFAVVDLRVDIGSLQPGERAALGKLVEAARVIDRIFLRQLWTGNAALEEHLRQDHSEAGRERLDAFLLYKGPWSDLDEHRAFLDGVPERKPLGAAFYPEDMTREEFEAWANPESTGFFTVIRRDVGGQLYVRKYSEEYAPELERCAALLREAAELTPNASLKRFLKTRAEAFVSNDYYESDVAWMDLDSPVDITLGPYETYNDELFGYKAGFEAYVSVRDDAETQKVQFFGAHMQEVEDNLPMDAKYRNPELGGVSGICVVNQVIASGDADHGVKAAAYVLPNDERIVLQKGSKRVMMKNVQEAKFAATLAPIAQRVLAPEALDSLSFDAFFTHILAHEMSHGIGPHSISVEGRATSPRQELKELHSAIEEAKADVLGIFMLQFFSDRGYRPLDEKKLYTTYLASSFRTLRFGLNEAHGRGMAVQFNYLASKKAFLYVDGYWDVDCARMRTAIPELARVLLTIEASGDYAGGKRMLETMGTMPASVEETLKKLSDMPVDIRPRFVTADAIAPEAK